MNARRTSVYAGIMVALLMGQAGSGLGGAAEGQPPGAPPGPPEVILSMRDAVKLAMGENNQIRLQVERIQAAAAQVNTQLGALLPVMSGTMSGNSQKFFLGQIGGSPVATDPFEIYDARSSMTMNVFSMSLLQRWQASKRGLEAAQFDAETTKLDTASTVALLYLEALRAQALHDASEGNVQLNAELLSLVQNRQTAGMATALDKARTQAQLEHEQQRLFALKGDVERSKLSLIRALGITFDTRVRMTDALKFFEVPLPGPNEALATAMEHRPDLKAQQQRVKLASLTLNSSTSERYPSLSAKADGGLVGSNTDRTVETHNVGLYLTIPFYDGQREGRIQESRSQVNQERIKMKDLTDQVTLDIRQAIATLIPVRQQVDIAQRGLTAALREMELARERFVMLASSNIELTNAQASVSRAKDNWIEALFRFNAARVNLARAQGLIKDLY